MSGEETLNIRSDGIETLVGGLENHQKENEENKESVDLEFTFDEMRKYLRKMGRKNLTDDEIKNITDDEIEEIKKYAKLMELKAIYKFVFRKKSVTDDDV